MSWNCGKIAKATRRVMAEREGLLSLMAILDFGIQTPEPVNSLKQRRHPVNSRHSAKAAKSRVEIHDRLPSEATLERNG
jgi:hypothetical protein